MSEKRQRQQQRRRQRQAAGSSRTNRSAPSGQSAGASAREVDRELSHLLTGMAEFAARDAHEPVDALEAAQWASSLIGTLDTGAMPGQDVEAMFLPGLVRALERLGTAGALATLRALSAVAGAEFAARAGAAADRVAAGGAQEPVWSATIGRTRPTTASLMEEPAFDDGFSLLVEYETPGDGAHTLGLYVDHNLGGLVKDAFVAGPLAEVRGQLAGASPERDGVVFRDVGLAEARARIEAALFAFDHTLDPPVDADVRSLRALMGARVALLPEAAEPSQPGEEVSLQEREALLAGFLDSAQGRRWRGDADAEDVISLAVGFGADYNHGGPLRWSPVVVEIFMTSWLARKVVREPGFFARVPEVLRDWVTYAGERRGVPGPALQEAVLAVEAHREALLRTAVEPEAWGPAKAFAKLAEESGVDLFDAAAVDAFVEHYNRELAG